MGIRFLLFFFLFSLPRIMCKESPDVTIIVRGSALSAETNDEFVCATIDWWPPQKCNYNQCPWGKASVFNLVKVRDGGTDWDWGVVVNVVKKPGTALASGVTPSRGTNYIVDTLLHCSPGLNENGSRAKPCPPRPGEKGEMHVVPVPLPLISGISSIRIAVPSDLRPAEARQTVLLAVQELGKRYPLSIQFFHLPLGISHGGSVFFSGDKSSCRHYQHGWFTKALHQTQLAEKIGQ